MVYRGFFGSLFDVFRSLSPDIRQEILIWPVNVAPRHLVFDKPMFMLEKLGSDRKRSVDFECHRRQFGSGWVISAPLIGYFERFNEFRHVALRCIALQWKTEGCGHRCELMNCLADVVLVETRIKVEVGQPVPQASVYDQAI